MAPMEHKIETVEIRNNTVIYTCVCGQKFIGPGLDEYGRAKCPETLSVHLESKKGE